MSKYNFALIGAAGYIAPRHMKAISDVGGNLIAALDPHDSVGVLDSYFPNASFFTEFERFDRHLEKCKSNGVKIHYISICSPNYLHDAHIRFALRYGADAICEKPVVLKPWNLHSLRELQSSHKNRVYTILQLRHHQSIISLAEEIDKNKIYDIELKYITPRGKWYDYSWKGDTEKSGGIIANIGIHLFDMLISVFGEVLDFNLKEKTNKIARGSMRLKSANVNWTLSISGSDLPSNIKGIKTYRSIKINGKEIEFSDGFTELHTISYRNILRGKGFSLDDVLPSIELVHNLNSSQNKTQV